MDEADAVKGIEELVGRRILHSSGGQFDFTHDAIRKVAYGELLPPARKLLHRRIAETLEGPHAANPGSSNAALARHYLGAEIWPKAARYSRCGRR